MIKIAITENNQAKLLNDKSRQYFGIYWTF